MKQRLLTLMLLLSVGLAAMAYDFESESSANGAWSTMPLYYNINNDGTTVTLAGNPDGYHVESVIIVPATVTHEGKSYSVTKIGYQAFKNSWLKGIRLPDTVEEIMDDAFSGSDRLESCQFGSGLKRIGHRAFWNTRLVSVVLPEGLTELGDYSFAGYTTTYLPNGTIKRLTLPSTLREIGESAFNGQSELTSVAIPEGVTEIKNSTFNECLALHTVTLPSTLQSIGDYAFCGCTLKTWSLPASVTHIGDYAFYGFRPGSSWEPLYYMSVTKIVVPETVKHLGNGAFADCRSLKSITLPTSLTVIPDNLCQGCDHLTQVTIPEGYTRVGLQSFSGCKSLTRVTLPSTIEEIDYNSFGWCGLVAINFPPRLKAISDQAFVQCNDLVEITIPETIDSIASGAFTDCASLKTVVVKGARTIESGAFGKCPELETVDLGGAVQYIGQSAFYECKKLHTVTGLDKVEVIDREAFKYCYKLTNITLPSTLKGLGEYRREWEVFYDNGYVFEGCTSLREITLPASVEHVGAGTFARCPNLAAVHAHRSIVNDEETSPIFDVENTTTLYVPIGSAPAYTASTKWNAANIVEEEVDDDILYRVRVIGSYSLVTINGEEASQADIKREAPVTVTITPWEGWRLATVLLNDEDVTDQMSGNTITIPSLLGNVKIEVTQEQEPLMMTILSAEGGAISVAVKQGERFQCAISPYEGWKLAAVTLDGVDMSEALVDGVLTTDRLFYNNSTLSIVFEKGDDAIHAADGQQVRLFVPARGQLTVQGAKAGDELRLYDTYGTLLYSQTLDGASQTLSIPASGVVIARIGQRTFKLCL